MKRFKFLLMSLVLLTSLLGSSGTVSASSYSTGKAIIPCYYTSTVVFEHFYVSNITDNPINVTITFYKKDGTIITDDNNISTGQITAVNSSSISNYSDQNSDSSLSFTLNPHCTEVYWLQYTTDANYGYGVIQWSQSGHELYGLVAEGVTIQINNGARVSGETIPINGGMPF